MRYKAATVWFLIFSLSACASNAQKYQDTSSVSQKSPSSQPSVKFKSQTSPKEPYYIFVDTPYALRAKTIPDNIREKCPELGRQLSSSVVKYAPEYEISVARTQNSLPATGRSVVLEIRYVLGVFDFNRAMFGGFASECIGINDPDCPEKKMIVDARLLVDDSTVSTMTFARKNGGFFFGNLKTTCNVLSGLAEKIGKDISEWLGTLEH